MVKQHNEEITMSVSHLVEEWMGTIEHTVAHSTFVKYEQLVRNHILPYFASMDYEDLDINCLNRFRMEVKQGKDCSCGAMSAGNQRTIFMILNNTLDYAYNSHQLDKRYYIKPGLARPRKTVRVFSEEDQRKMEAYLLSHRDEYSLAILIALYTGLRIGEICAIQWKDIDMEMHALSVNKTVQRLKKQDGWQDGHTELEVSHPKSAASNRLIPLSDFLLEYVRPFYTGRKDAYILTNRIDIPMEPRTLQYQYKKILQKTGVPYLNFHCLRHTFATRCVMLGWDMKTLSEVLGHFDVKITMEYYFHSSFEFKQQQMNKLIPLSQN